MQQVHLQEEAAQLALGLQILDPLDAIALQPEAAQACVLLQVLNAVKAWWGGAGQAPGCLEEPGHSWLCLMAEAACLALQILMLKDITSRELREGALWGVWVSV